MQDFQHSGWDKQSSNIFSSPTKCRILCDVALQHGKCRQFLYSILLLSKPNNPILLIFYSQSPFDPVSAGFRYLCIMCSLAWPSFYCYFANVVTDRISYIGDSVYDLNWYDYPPNLRKHMTLIIVRSQRKIYFNGLNLINCTLETFGKVSSFLIEILKNFFYGNWILLLDNNFLQLFKSSCSYYIIFRSISQR